MIQRTRLQPAEIQRTRLLRAAATSSSACLGTTTTKSVGHVGTSQPIKAALDAAGATYISTDAGSSADQQIADVENLIAQGAQALIILAQDGTAILPAVQSAADQGIPVIAYDRLIEDASAFYITFDNVEVGRMQAREIFAAVPKGRYVMIKGNAADANADFLRGGQQEVLQAAIDAGDIEIVGEAYTDNWDPAVAQTNMEQFLTELNNEVDAVVASNDGTAGGVIAALAAQGLDGIVPVSGQDGDGAALNRVALGTQTGLRLEGTLVSSVRPPVPLPHCSQAEHQWLTFPRWSSSIHLVETP